MRNWMMAALAVCNLLSLTTFAAEGEFLPSNIYLMDTRFSHHVIVVEKQTHKLHLFQNSGSQPKLIKTYPTLTGKFKGGKKVDGDHKTPEGVYNFTQFLKKEELFKRYGDYAKIYGIGAFPMDYPNFIDQREDRKGGGIWLHSTDDDNRISKELDSRGCVVMANNDLKEISQHIEIDHTPIVVVQDLNYLSKTTWESNRTEISALVAKWTKAWQDKDFNTYIGTYDPNRFHDSVRGNYNSFKDYKKAVFSRADKPNITIDSISILAGNDYAVVFLRQDYRSVAINDVGKKTLYLRKDDNYDWKIVGEQWEKYTTDKPAFLISNRFFD